MGEISGDNAPDPVEDWQMSQDLASCSVLLHGISALPLLCRLMGRLAVSAFQIQQVWINLPSMLKRFVKYDLDSWEKRKITLPLSLALLSTYSTSGDGEWVLDIQVWSKGVGVGWR